MSHAPRPTPSRLSLLRSLFENPPGSEVEGEGGMLVRRVSAFTGIEREVVLPITPEQLASWRAGALIQCAMPHLTPDQREFIKTGVTPDEWEWTFGKASASENGEGRHDR